MTHTAKIVILISLGLLLLIPPVNAQNRRDYSVVFYNVENLFDTLDNPQINDDDFLPHGKLKWTQQRYQQKLSHLSSVLSSINSNDLPEIIGLCEVENRGVLEDLTHQKALRKGRYRIVHDDSPDYRGIDCALIYRPSKFKYISHNTIAVSISESYKTRDILYTKGIVGRRDTLHIFVNHWPSRRGGLTKSEPNRIIAARHLRGAVDSIMNINSNSNIIIMGDFNDQPSNKSVHKVLNAVDPNQTIEGTALVNLMYPPHNRGLGSYNYRGNWNMLDNMIVSRNLLTKKRGYHVYPQEGHIYSPHWISYQKKSQQWAPSRTYSGKRYFGGYSDHYPVYFKLIKK